MMKKKWIQGMDMNEGKFTSKAKKAGKSVQEYAQEKRNAPGTLGKEARLASTLSKLTKKKQ